MTNFTESVVEEAALDWLRELGYTVVFGPAIAPGEPLAERTGPNEVLLRGRLEAALARLNPQLPPAAWAEARRKLANPDRPSLVANNHAVHRLLVDGVTVEYQRADGSIAGAQVRVIDYDEPANNDFLAVNQFTVIENHHNRRPDVVIFVNGLPLAVIELKNAADENATIWNAFHQLQTYKAQIPTLFAYNAALVISDGVSARIGTLTADRERFAPWRTIAGEELAPAHLSQLEVLLKGVFDRRRLLDLLRYFIVFEDMGNGNIAKKMAAYHQFHAVNVALLETLRASRPEGEELHAIGETSMGKFYAAAQAEGAPGDRRAGVVWHTQGSGKSLTMAFYAGRVILHPAMRNPTIVVITDRNDLDDQLFGTFARCSELLRQPPVQAESRAHLRELLRVDAGGVVFTTIQKFWPEGSPEAAEGDERGGAPQETRGARKTKEIYQAGGTQGQEDGVLSGRRNIVVIADEAHRSQYDFVDGFARRLRDALPGASFIGFTGTPVELTDRNTQAVFGDYISIYDIQRAVMDGATVPIYYESRLARLQLDEAERPRLDEDFDEVTEGEEEARVQALKSRWAQLEALVGAERRIQLVAADLVAHFERRREALEGKAMVVCMSRRICVELYDAITALRPSWHHPDDDKGLIKIVMTGSASDPQAFQPHVRNKARRELLANRFKDSKDPFTIVIVRDMWLTGFDAPSLHTMYLDKPMRGHGLMQAIARVNRVFQDKPGGLVVDYLGLADELRKALATYTQSGGSGRTAIDQAEAVAVMLEKYEVCCGLFHGFDWGIWASGTPAQRVSLLPAAQEHIVAQADGKPRLLAAVTALSQAFALAVPHAETFRIRDDVGFFQAVRAVLAKETPDGRKTPDEMDHAIRQLIAKAVASDEVIDIFAAAGLKKPDISILDESFLAEVRGMPQRNLAVELLRKLLANEIKLRGRSNVVQARSFAEMLEGAIRRYQNRAVETAQVIEELIALAQEMRQARERGAALGLSEDELAFYDALEVNDSAVQVLGDAVLRQMAQELAAAIRRNVTVDWTVRESVRAQLRVLVKRILRKHGYPPDKREKAAQLVLEQAEALAGEAAEEAA
jgi:type I restriction enzyme R subunit